MNMRGKMALGNAYCMTRKYVSPSHTQVILTRRSVCTYIKKKKVYNASHSKHNPPRNWNIVVYT